MCGKYGRHNGDEIYFLASRTEAMCGTREQQNSVLVPSKPSTWRCLHANESSETYILAQQTFYGKTWLFQEITHHFKLHPLEGYLQILSSCPELYLIFHRPRNSPDESACNLSTGLVAGRNATSAPVSRSMHILIKELFSLGSLLIEWGGVPYEHIQDVGFPSTRIRAQSVDIIWIWRKLQKMWGNKDQNVSY
jgi:hypothetical protein